MRNPVNNSGTGINFKCYQLFGIAEMLWDGKQLAGLGLSWPRNGPL